jgi:predicted phosphohydrolase
MKVTLISDTHTKHRYCENDLPGGDLLIHAGDFMNSGYDVMEAVEFFEWFDQLNNYHTKVFIAGNHDRWMQNDPIMAEGILDKYDTIIYLEDDWMTVGDSDPHDPNVKTAKIYGSPWQPEFYNWAFNLPRNGGKLKLKWDAIPTNTDILITHGPAQTYLDTAGAPYNTPLLGCELLKERIEEIKPKIHVCGHIHGGYGYYYNGHTHFFNASILNEQYNYSNLPFTFEWNPVTNEINWL